jgi:hypothetical protein
LIICLNCLFQDYDPKSLAAAEFDKLAQEVMQLARI